MYCIVLCSLRNSVVSFLHGWFGRFGHGGGGGGAVFGYVLLQVRFLRRIFCLLLFLPTVFLCVVVFFVCLCSLRIHCFLSEFIDLLRSFLCVDVSCSATVHSHLCVLRDASRLPSCLCYLQQSSCSFLWFSRSPRLIYVPGNLVFLYVQPRRLLSPLCP
jgi:hypothetical protein